MTEARYEAAIRYLREQALAALLREGGFGWDDRTLDGVRAELIGEAALIVNIEW